MFCRDCFLKDTMLVKADEECELCGCIVIVEKKSIESYIDVRTEDVTVEINKLEEEFGALARAKLRIND